jgi:hypothetical protein
LEDKPEMKTALFSLLVLSPFARCPISIAQSVIDPVTGEQIIEIQVKSSDFAAAGTGHHRVHSAGALRPGGGRYASKTFETENSGALVEVTAKSRALAHAAAASAASQASTGAPPFAEPGFYPGDLSLNTIPGQVVTQAQVHNIYINCTASCWSNPATFERNLFLSRFIHVVDQYVGSEKAWRYTVGPSLVINNYPITSQLVTNPLVNFADIDTITHAAASNLGSGYNHIFNIFLPEGVDVCNGYAPPYTSCFSPDDSASFTFCAEHGEDSFPDIPGIELVALGPYPDVVATDSKGLPYYGCDVGQPNVHSDTYPTPNGVLVDSISSFLSHEIFETITDPDAVDWYVSSDLPFIGSEIGDVCQLQYFVYPPFLVAGQLYEIQPEYSNKYHACVTVP